MEHPRAGAVVGAGPVIRAMAAHLGLIETIDRAVSWDADRWRLSPGERIVALLVNLWTEREPLYRVQEAFALTDPALLLGQGITPADLGDDALGRALDKLAQAGAAAVVTAVAARAYAVESIRPTGMHCDTTSRSLYGAYPTADGTVGVTPRYGHSQAPRENLKQIVLTCFVNRDGGPLMGTVEDGHRSDKRLNREPIDRLVQAFSPAALQDLVYVADSALVTGPNREALAATGRRWLSRLPDTVRAAALAKAAAWAGPDWIPVGRIAQRRTAADYQASEQTGRIGDRAYRLVVYRSASLDHRKAKSLDRHLAQIRAAAERAAADLAAHDFACVADAEAAATAFRAEPPSWWGCQTTVRAVTHTAKRPRPGRPRRDAAPPTRTVYRVQVTWGPRDEAAGQTDLQRRSPFVLITTLPADQYDARALLAEYKGQTSVEMALSQTPLRSTALSAAT